VASDIDIKASNVVPLTGRPARFQGGLREVAPGAYAWLQPNGAWGEANAGLIVGNGASIVIDTLWDESLARQMLDAMAAHVRNAPIRTVLNTHSDGDHWWGNATMPADAEIITCTPSRTAMDAESSPQELARLARLARLTHRAPGSIGGLSTYIGDMLSPFDLAAVRLRYPDRTFDERTALDVGGREVQLLVLGPAHTPGDTIAYLPDARVVFAADLVFVKAIPVMWHGPSAGWLRALDTLLALDAHVYVPGHGDIAGPPELEAMKRFWTWLRDAAADRRAAAQDPLTATEALIRSGGFDEFRDWECPERLLISVAALNRELAGQPPMEVSPAVRGRLFRQVATLQQRLRDH
jgi:cyclase